MKRSIKDSHLRQSVAEHFSGSNDPFDVCWIMERRQLDAVFDATQHGIVNCHRLSETFPTMDHTVPNSMNIRDALNLRDASFRARPTHYELDCRPGIAEFGSGSLSVVPFRLK